MVVNFHMFIYMRPILLCVFVVVSFPHFLFHLNQLLMHYSIVLSFGISDPPLFSVHCNDVLHAVAATVTPGSRPAASLY